MPMSFLEERKSEEKAVLCKIFYFKVKNHGRNTYELPLDYRKVMVKTFPYHYHYYYYYPYHY